MGKQISRADLARLLDPTFVAGMRKRQCERSLLAFVKYFWPVVEPQTPLQLGKPLDAICQHLEAVTRGDIQKLLINVPPGSMKSLLTNVLWPAWEWTTRPHLRYVTFSYAAALTKRDNRKFLSIVSSPQYQAFWGDIVQLEKQGEELVSNKGTGFKLATSFGGVGTGERGDRVILDDPHNVKEAESDLVRTSTTEWFRNAMSNRLNDMMTSQIVVIMQRVHEADVSGVILDSRLDYTHLMIPAEFEPGRESVNEIGWTDWRTEEGESFWPERYSLDTLAGIKRTMLPFAYAGQYQQRPAPKGGGIIQADWWQPWLGKKYPDFSYRIASLDTAYTEKQENDQSALTIWGVYRDDAGITRVLLIWAWSDWLAFHNLLDRVSKDCLKWKVDTLLIEAKANGISVAQEMRRIYGRVDFGINMIDPGNLDKVARAHAVANLFYEGIIQAPYVSREDDDTEPDRPRAWAEKVIHQCATFPRSTFKDLVDSTTQGIAYLRRTGLIERKVDVDAEEAERSMLPPRNPKLYPG